jgi:hypothetical protein
MPTKKVKEAYAYEVKTGSAARRRQDFDPGYGWTMKREGDWMWFGVNIKKRGRLSQSNKSHTIATTKHKYHLHDYGLPDHFVILNCCKALPTAKAMPLDRIKEGMKD